MSDSPDSSGRTFVHEHIGHSPEKHFYFEIECILLSACARTGARFYSTGGTAIRHGGQDAAKAMEGRERPFS